ncbi:unnamed protein product [Moneuplotes crassus]|uniref:Uncharacterized protein n=1 Tax=Euplotes crassus TaxID=5936 RepID=A0AAD1U1J0_EUPCR|nr:unnamed protein product [Moneuplotes crassus]
MYKYTNQSIGNVKSLNKRLRHQVTMIPEDAPYQFGKKGSPRKIPFPSKSTKLYDNTKRRKSVMGSNISRFAPPSSQNLAPPIKRKSTVRAQTIGAAERTPSAMNVINSFFGSTKSSPKYKNGSKGIHEEEKSLEMTPKRSNPKMRISKNFVKQTTIKEEVTISEYEINKKWYDYEKKTGKDFSLPSSKMIKTTQGPEAFNFSTPNGALAKLNTSINRGINSGSINSFRTPNKFTLPNNSFDSRVGGSESPMKNKIRRRQTKLLSLNHKDLQKIPSLSLKCCDCELIDVNCSINKYKNEQNIMKQSNSILLEEIKQLRDLNGQLIDKLNKFQDNEAAVLDRHLEYEHIEEGFEKICKNFSNEVDPSLGNLSVRGATKKMLLNLQQFCYEQISSIKICYMNKVEQLKGSFTEEIENLSEALATTSMMSLEYQKKFEKKCLTKAAKEDSNSDKIQELQVKLKAVSQEFKLYKSKFETADKELSETKILKEIADEKLAIMKEKMQREKEAKESYKERLEELETKYQNISISTMHTKLSSLKTQLDLQKLEDAKKLYDKDKKLKKAIQALKSFQTQRRDGVIKLPENLGNEETADPEEASESGGQSPTKEDLPELNDQNNFEIQSEDEDPAEIERNIKKMLAEEEMIKKQKEEAAIEPEIVELDNEVKYQVDREKFEQALSKNPNLDNLY